MASVVCQDALGRTFDWNNTQMGKLNIFNSVCSLILFGVLLACRVAQRWFKQTWNVENLIQSNTSHLLRVLTGWNILWTIAQAVDAWAPNLPQNTHLALQTFLWAVSLYLEVFILSAILVSVTFLGEARAFVYAWRAGLVSSLCTTGVCFWIEWKGSSNDYYFFDVAVSAIRVMLSLLTLARVLHTSKPCGRPLSSLSVVPKAEEKTTHHLVAIDDSKHLEIKKNQPAAIPMSGVGLTVPPPVCDRRRCDGDQITTLPGVQSLPVYQWSKCWLIYMILLYSANLFQELWHSQNSADFACVKVAVKLSYFLGLAPLSLLTLKELNINWKQAFMAKFFTLSYQWIEELNVIYDSPPQVLPVQTTTCEESPSLLSSSFFSSPFSCSLPTPTSSKVKCIGEELCSLVYSNWAAFFIAPHNLQPLVSSRKRSTSLKFADAGSADTQEESRQSGEAKEIGRGAFGSVKLYDYKGKQVAVKMMRMHSLLEDSGIQRFRREIFSLLQAQRCPQIVHCYGLFFDMTQQGPQIGMVMEYASGGSLFDLLPYEIIAHSHYRDSASSSSSSSSFPSFCTSALFTSPASNRKPLLLQNQAHCRGNSFILRPVSKSIACQNTSYSSSSLVSKYTEQHQYHHHQISISQSLSLSPLVEKKKNYSSLSSSFNQKGTQFHRLYFWKLALDCARALLFVHDTMHSVFLDLKPGNFVVQSTGEGKLIDLGSLYHLSKRRNNNRSCLGSCCFLDGCSIQNCAANILNQKTNRTTPHIPLANTNQSHNMSHIFSELNWTDAYAAPELLESKEVLESLGPACDIWSFAFFLWSCLTGIRTPFVLVPTVNDDNRKSLSRVAVRPSSSQPHVFQSTTNCTHPTSGSFTESGGFSLSSSSSSSISSSFLGVGLSPSIGLQGRNDRGDSDDVSASSLFNVHFVTNRFEVLKYYKAMNLRPPIPVDLPDELSQLLMQCWTLSPALRPSMSVILQKLTLFEQWFLDLPSSSLPRFAPEFGLHYQQQG